MSEIAPTPGPESIATATGQHDSASQALIAGMIVAALAIIALAAVGTVIVHPDASNVAWPIVSVIAGGLIAQLNSPTGIANVLASSAKNALFK